MSSVTDSSLSGVIALDVHPESASVKEGFMADIAPNGDGVDKDVVLHPQMLVETDGLLLLRKSKLSREAHAAVIVARGGEQHVMTIFFVSGEEESRSVGRRVEERPGVDIGVSSSGSVLNRHRRHRRNRWRSLPGGGGGKTPVGGGGDVLQDKCDPWIESKIGDNEPIFIIKGSWIQSWG